MELVKWEFVVGAFSWLFFLVMTSKNLPGCLYSVMKLARYQGRNLFDSYFWIFLPDMVFIIVL